MAITFTDEDMVYLDKEQDTQLRSIRQAIDALKLKGDTLPGGYTGYYYKWKAILYSDGRKTPIFDGLTVWEFVKIQARELAGKAIIRLYACPNPLIVSPIGLNNVNPRTTAGYPSSPAGGDYISDSLSGNNYNALQKYSIWTRMKISLLARR
ncbi:MAG: hypothetical protein OIN86_08340 [Candidatus Methanoperedens sp.]|nr:hypothetical protein [Candidatus Methanoperedens sp.]CAG1005451.1 hypothetical protein METP1_03245 [Methanosarcinales archaeon]